VLCNSSDFSTLSEGGFIARNADTQRHLSFAISNILFTNIWNATNA
jgi:hypothetical protein